MAAPKPSAKPQTSCSACQKSRQKCDKKTPTCSRCERIGICCERPELIRLWTTEDMVPRPTNWKKKDKGCKPEPYYNKKVLAPLSHGQYVPVGPPTPVSPPPPSTSPSPPQPNALNTFPMRHRASEQHHNQISLPINLQNVQSRGHLIPRQDPLAPTTNAAFLQQYMPQVFPSPPPNPYEQATASVNSPQRHHHMTAAAINGTGGGADAGIFTSPLDQLAEWIWQDQTPFYLISRKLDETQEKDPAKFFKWLLSEFEQRIRDGSPRGQSTSVTNSLRYAVKAIEQEMTYAKDESVVKQSLMDCITGIRNETTQVIPLGVEQQFSQNNIQPVMQHWVKLYVSIYYNLWSACKDIEHMIKMTTTTETVQVLEPWSDEMWVQQLILNYPEYNQRSNTLINRVLNVISGKRDISNNTNLETLLYSWILANLNAPRRPLDIGYELFQSLVDELGPTIFGKLYNEFSHCLGKLCMNPVSSLMLQYMIGSLVKTQPQMEVQMIIRHVLDAFSYWLSPAIAKKELVLNFVKMLKNAGVPYHSFLVARLCEAFGAFNQNNPDTQRDFVQCVIRMQTYQQWLEIKRKSRGMISHRDYTKEGAEILWELLTLAEDDNTMVIDSFIAQQPMEFYSLVCYINTPTDSTISSRAVTSERFHQKVREVMNDHTSEQSPPPPTPIPSHSAYMMDVTTAPTSAGSYFVPRRASPSNPMIQSPLFQSLHLPARNGFQLDAVPYQQYPEM